MRAGDLASPNPAYFERVDKVLQLAAKHGLLVMLAPAETSGWLGTLRAKGRKEVEKFGIYLGQRYKDFPNIVWLSGNDFQS